MSNVLRRMELFLCFLFFLISTLSGQFVKRQGNKLLLDDEEFSFSGVNIYWLGQDENNPVSPNGPKPYFHHPSRFRYKYEFISMFSDKLHFRIDDVLYSAYSMGSRVVRSHTLGKTTIF